MRRSELLPRMRRALADERGNCFLYGCVTVVVICLLGGLVAFLSLRYMMSQVREKYTAPAAVELPTVEMAQADIDALVTRVDAYADDLRADKPLEPIKLTEAEINALLQNHPDLKDTYGDHMYVTLGEGTVTAQMSLPLDWLPLFRERYFNGTATFDVGFLDGRFQIYLNSASVKGEDVPTQQIRQLRGENLGETWDDDPDARELMRKIDTISIAKDGVTITPKAPASGTGVPPAETAAPSAEETPPAEGETPAAEATPEAA